MTVIVFKPELREGPRPEWPKNEQGITRIEVDGSTVRVVGWFDSIAFWEAEVELTEEQRRQLHEATR